MSWKKLLESAKESLNDHLRLRNEYLMAENRILRNQINGRVQLTDSERKELAEIGAKLGNRYDRKRWVKWWTYQQSGLNGYGMVPFDLDPSGAIR